MKMLKDIALIAAPVSPEYLFGKEDVLSGLLYPNEFEDGSRYQLTA